jgi:hypothetical protein
VLNKEGYLPKEDADLSQREDNLVHFAKNHLVNKDIFAQELMAIKDNF